MDEHSAWRDKVKNDLFNEDDELREDENLDEWIQELKVLIGELKSQLGYHQDNKSKDEWRKKTKFLYARCEMRLSEAKDIRDSVIVKLYNAVQVHKASFKDVENEAEEEDFALWAVFGFED